MKTFLRRTLNLQCCYKVVPINPLGPIVHGLYFSSDNVFSIRCIRFINNDNNLHTANGVAKLKLEGDALQLLNLLTLKCKLKTVLSKITIKSCYFKLSSQTQVCLVLNLVAIFHSMSAKRNLNRGHPTRIQFKTTSTQHC